jgi:transglutaminase-like putative cysteine protease
LDPYRVLWLDYRGAPQTVALIRQSVHEAQHKPIVRALAERITEGLANKDPLSEALAYYHMVLGRCRYMRDPRTIEYVRAPWVIANEIFAGRVPALDCDDQAALICALAAISGAECRVVTVAFRDMFFQGMRQYSHIFAQVREPRTGAWLTLDPVAGDKTEEMIKRVKAAKFWPIV